MLTKIMMSHNIVKGCRHWRKQLSPVQGQYFGPDYIVEIFEEAGSPKIILSLNLHRKNLKSCCQKIVEQYIACDGVIELFREILGTAIWITRRSKENFESAVTGVIYS